MNILSFFHLISFMVDMLLIVYVISRNRGVLLNRLCALFFSSAAIWSLFSFILGEAATFEQASFYLNLAALGWYVAPGIALAFFLVLARREVIVKSRLFSIGMAALTLLLIYQQCAGTLLYPEATDLGWSILWQPTFYTFLYLLYTFIVSLAALYLLIGISRQAKTNTQKKQATMLILSGLVTVIFAAAINLTLSYIHISILPDVADVAFIIFGVGIVLAVSRYGLMSINPVMASNEILLSLIHI